VFSAAISVMSASAFAAADWSINLVSGSTTGSAPVITDIDGYADTNGSGNLRLYENPPSWSGGYGLYSDPDANHGLDNIGNNESLLFSFGTSVSLSSVTIGYISGDSDISVLAYTGGTIPPSSLTSNSYSNLTLANSGWTLIGNYSNLGLNTPRAINAGQVSSSYWLIAAYNQTFGGTWTQDNDYVKVLAVAGNTTTPPPPGQVSEPAALFIFGTALLGVVGLRRRRESVN